VLHYSTAEDVVRGPHVCIGTSEEGVVSLYNEEVGMWEYNLSGVGVRPGMMDPTRITATLGSDGSSFVSWRNPFVDPVKVSLAYAVADHYSCFGLCPGCCICVPWALLAPTFGLAFAFDFALVPLALLVLVFVSAFVFAVACPQLYWHLLVALPLHMSLHLPACFHKFTLLWHEDTCISAPHRATLLDNMTDTGRSLQTTQYHVCKKATWLFIDPLAKPNDECMLYPQLPMHCCKLSAFVSLRRWM